MKQKKCKICKEVFSSIRPLQMVCSPQCGYEYAKRQKDKKKKKETKEWKERKKEIKAKLKTKQDYVNELQILVNRYVRNRDKDKNCISCKKKLYGKFDAGHFFSVGNYPSVRFDLRNIHGQCVHCNKYLGGNLHEYRENLIELLTEDEFGELDRLAHRNRQYTLGEIKGMITKHKVMLKEQEKE